MQSSRFNASTIGMDCWSNHDNVKINARMKSQVELTFVDFMLLANHHVILPCNLKAQAFVLLPKAGNGNGNIQIGKGNRNVFSDHQIALKSSFKKNCQMVTRFF